jgi:tetratricopeptide (TPR) repeat protein
MFYQLECALVRALVQPTPYEIRRSRSIIQQCQRWYEAHTELPDAKLGTCHALLFDSMIQLAEGHLVSGAQSLNQAWKTCQRVNRNAVQASVDSQIHARALEGAFVVVFSAIPSEYQWVARLLGLTGDAEVGIRALENGSGREYATALPALALYFAYKSTRHDPYRARQTLLELHRRHPNTVLPLYLRLQNAFDLRSPTETHALLDSLNRLPRATELIYLNYQRARAALFRLDAPSALKAYQAFVTQKPGIIYSCDAWYKIGLLHDWQGERAQAVVAYRRCLQTGTSSFDDDHHARKQAVAALRTTPNAHTIALQKARFAYDGGQYGLASQQLRHLLPHWTILTTDQRTEWYYRNGRLAEALGQTALAIRQYELAARQPAQQARWMSLYARYYLGRLIETTDPNRARTEYAYIRTQSGYDYQKGLEQKVKTALAYLKTPR